jgi:predicted transcriptional regulator
MRQISPHEVRVFLAMAADNQWRTSRQIAEAANVAERTARHHVSAFVRLGIAEHLETFGGYRYRLVNHDTDYANRLRAAAKVFGLTGKR